MLTRAGGDRREMQDSWNCCQIKENWTKNFKSEDILVNERMDLGIFDPSHNGKIIKWPNDG